MASLSQLRSVLKEILDSTASLVQGRTRGGADGSTVWVDVINGQRVQAKAFGSITPGTCGVIQDKSGQWWAIGQGQGSTVTEQVQFYRHRRRAKPSSKETADVAVLLSCEKDDKYDIWLTYLGDTRKNRFAFVGSMPKRVESNSYWAWESSNGGRFEFNPYRGATGGGISISTTPTNHDGAQIGASATGASYQSEAWNGGGDKGGVVTPKWTETLTDYSVTVDTYLATLCDPTRQYTDVTWEWSDGGGGYALRKVPGKGVTTSSNERKIGTKWEVSWGYDGGGGFVVLGQEEEPDVDVNKIQSDTGNTYVIYIPGQRPIYRNEPFTLTRDQRRKTYVPGVSARLLTCHSPQGTILMSEWDFVTEWVIDPGSEGFGFDAHWHINGIRTDFLSDPKYGCRFDFIRSTPTMVVAYFKNGEPFDTNEYKLDVSSGSEVWSLGWTEKRPNNPERETIPPGDSNTYTIAVFDKDGIEVASEMSSLPISETTEKIETKRVGFYIKQDGENINGQFDDSGGPLPSGFEDGDEAPQEYRDFEIRDGKTAPTVTGEVNLVTAKIQAWLEVSGEELAKVELDGEEGQGIIESPAYEEATKPYTAGNGQTIYPCYPQKSEKKDVVRSFGKGEGFNLYYITHYVTEGDEGITEWVPFDFNNPGLSGYLPSPAVNFLYSTFFSSIKVEYNPKGILAWGKDIPEEDSRLEEEEEEGIDPYGVVYPFAWGFIYGLYGPIKASNFLLNQEISKEDGEILLANYNMNDWGIRARSKKPRMYAMEPDDTTSGEPFTEADITDLDQRTLNRIENAMMSLSFRRNLWGTVPSSIGNESEENWRSGSVGFPPPSATGQEVLNRSSVKQRGDDLKNIKVEMADVKALLKAEKKADVKALLKAEKKADVRFHLYPEADFTGEATTQTFKMNPIQDVFEGYDDVQIIAAAGIIY